MSLVAGRWFPDGQKGRFFLAAGEDALLTDRPEDCLRLLGYCFAAYNRAVEIPFPGPEKKLNELYGRMPWRQALTSLQLAGPSRRRLGRLKSLLYAGDIEPCRRQIEKSPRRLDYLLLKAQLLRMTEEYRLARRLLVDMTASFPVVLLSEVYHEALFLSLNFDYDWRSGLWADIEKNSL